MQGLTSSVHHRTQSKTRKAQSRNCARQMQLLNAQSIALYLRKLKDDMSTKFPLLFFFLLKNSAKLQAAKCLTAHYSRLKSCADHSTAAQLQQGLCKCSTHATAQSSHYTLMIRRPHVDTSALIRRYVSHLPATTSYSVPSRTGIQLKVPTHPTGHLRN